MTRIEGHMRVEAKVEGGKIADAWVAGTMWRGLEVMLKGRDPRGRMDVRVPYLRSLNYRSLDQLRESC